MRGLADGDAAAVVVSVVLVPALAERRVMLASVLEPGAVAVADAHLRAVQEGGRVGVDDPAGDGV